MMTSTKSYYLFASAKEWHLSGYRDLVELLGIHAGWVSNPDELKLAVEDERPRYIFFLHWNWIVPADVWTKHECVCFHMTDVPYGRGGSPLQNLIAAGHKDTKLTALRMVDELDAGPVYAKRPLSLDGRAEDIYIRAGNLSFNMARWIIETNPEPTPQQGDATIFTRRKPAQSYLPPSATLDAIYDHIRMLDAPGYPQAFLQHGDLRLEFSMAELQNNELHAKVIIRKIPSDERET